MINKVGCSYLITDKYTKYMKISKQLKTKSVKEKLDTSTKKIKNSQLKNNYPIILPDIKEKGNLNIINE